MIILAAIVLSASIGYVCADSFGLYGLFISIPAGYLLGAVAAKLYIR